MIALLLVLAAQTDPGLPPLSGGSGGGASASTVTSSTGTAPDVAVFTGAHTIGNGAVRSNSGGTDCTTGTLALGVVGDPDTGLAAPAANELDVCTNGARVTRALTGSQMTFGPDAITPETDARTTFELLNGNKSLDLTQFDNSDGVLRFINTNTSNGGRVGYGHSSGSGHGPDAFDMFMGNDRASGAGGLCLYVNASDGVVANQSCSMYLEYGAVGRRITALGAGTTRLESDVTATHTSRIGIGTASITLEADRTGSDGFVTIGTANVDSSVDIVPDASGTLKLGGAGDFWKELFVSDSVFGNSDAKPLTFSDADGFLFDQKTIATPQSAACAAGVLALDPTNDVVEIDANGAACVVTLGEANANVGRTVTMVITATPGAGLVTFPDVAGKHLGPTLCTTTGIGLGGTYTVYYAGTVLEYVGKSCEANQ